MPDPSMQPRPGEQHPEEWRRDLNPEPLAGQNVGIQGHRYGNDMILAVDVKDLHERLSGFSSDDLRQIPLLRPGTRFEQNATYINLRDAQPREFTGRAGEEVGQHDWIVPKTEVGYQLWNRLIGVENPERLGVADGR